MPTLQTALKLFKTGSRGDKQKARNNLLDMGYWTTRTGEVMHVSQMTSEHMMAVARLINRDAHKRLQRQKVAETFEAMLALSTLGGEEALYHIENQITYRDLEMEEDTVESLVRAHPFTKHLLHDSFRRHRYFYQSMERTLFKDEVYNNTATGTAATKRKRGG